MDTMGNKKSLKNNENRTSDFILNITANDAGDVHGKIQHCESGETRYFRSLIELILLINGKLDQLKFSEPTNQIRSWSIHKIPLALKGGRVL